MVGAGHLQGGAGDDGVQLPGAHEVLAVGHALEGLVDLGVVLLGEVVAQLANHLHHLADLVVRVQAHPGGVADGHIGEGRLVLLVRLQQLVQLAGHPGQLRGAQVHGDVQGRALHLHEPGQLLERGIARGHRHALHAVHALGDGGGGAGRAHAHFVAHLHEQLRIGKGRDIFHHARNEGGELVRQQNAGGVAQRHPVRAGLDGGGDGLMQEFRLGPGGVHGGELHALTHAAGGLHLPDDRLQHGRGLLVAAVLHQRRGQGRQQVEPRMPRALHALPGLLQVAGSHVHRRDQRRGHHGRDGLAGQLVRLAAVHRGQLDAVHLQAVQAAGDLQLLLEGQRAALQGVHFSEGHVNQLNGLHGVTPRSKF